MVVINKFFELLYNVVVLYTKLYLEYYFRLLLYKLRMVGRLPITKPTHRIISAHLTPLS